MAAAGEQISLHKLTRRHAIKLSPPDRCSVEECSLAVGEIVGYESVKSASRMNNAVVIFLDHMDKVNQLLESGVVIQGTFTPVLSLVNPAKKIIISNVPPFLKNELLEKELGRHGKLVSPIKMIPISCKSPHLKHVVSFRRQVHMILKKSDEELNIVFKFKVDDFDYTVHVTSETMKCFGCGTVGHVIRSCPERVGETSRSAAVNAAEPPSDRAESVTPLPDEQQGITQVSQEEIRDGSDQENEAMEDSVSKQSEQNVQDDFSVGCTATRVAESVLLNEEDVLKDVDLSKMSTKRKNPENKLNTEQVTKVSRSNLMSSSQLDEGLMNTQESESDACGETQMDVESVYSFTRIQSFLQRTKGMRSMKIDDFFPDLKLFHDSVKLFMKNTERPGQPTFTDQEIFRLKKMMIKVRAQIVNDG